MIDVCYERLCGRLIGFMRMTREFFCVCLPLCVCIYMGMNQTIYSSASSPVVVEARGLNDIGAEEGVTLS